ncbi:MAG: hemolysin III family protein [Clostridia bacterium]|nr:hemolysin III family protein [Clostridia bacterium]
MRTPLNERKLPDYTRGEEIFNMVTHIAGGAFGLVVLVLCTVVPAVRHDSFAMAGGIIYGVSMVLLYTISSVYHGLTAVKAKKVMQVLDHCTIYALIYGTYVPILLTNLLDYYPKAALIILCCITVGTAVGVTFTAIDFQRYKIISHSCYFIVGWCAVFAVKYIIRAFGLPFFLWILAGGCFYTFGMIFYAKGKHKRWFHSIFHIFILLGSALQFVGIFRWCIC